MKKLFRYMKGYGKECVFGPLFKLLEASFELMIPLVVAKIVDVGIANGDKSYVLKMCMVMVLLGVIGLICSLTAQYFAAKAAVGFATRLRHSVLERLLGLSYTQLDTLGSSTMITRMTSDINQVQNGVNLTLRLLLRSPFVVFGAMIMAFTIDFDAAMTFVGVIPVLSVIVFGIMLITMPMYRRVQAELDGVTADTRQNLSGVRVLRAFRMENAETKQFEAKTQSLTASQMGAGRISGILNPLTFVVINLAVVVLIHTGAVKVSHGVLTQGLVIALYNYMSQILVELIKMANLIINMTKAAACADRVASVLEITPESRHGNKQCDLKGKVEFRDVTAKYAGASAPSLEHISFTAQPGQTVGIIGGTGSGKTTLVNLIPGFYPAEAGQVLLDGEEVSTYDAPLLRRRIGIVPQKAVLFSGTIRENLLWGNPNASDRELWEALEQAQIADMVSGMERGLSAAVAQGGSNLSGGQRQRLTIARALVRKPDILIMDDSTSALDYATDAHLRAALRAMPNAPTTFIVSQRAASVREADMILVLEEGCLVGIGTHEELLNECAVYQQIYYSQFPKEVGVNG